MHYNADHITPKQVLGVLNTLFEQEIADEQYNELLELEEILIGGINVDLWNKTKHEIVSKLNTVINSL